MSWINTFVHSEIFFYGLIVLFLIVLVIFGIVVYLECKKLKINQAREHAKKLEQEKKMDQFAARPKVEKQPIEKPVEIVKTEIAEKELIEEVPVKKESEKKRNTQSSASMNDIERLLSRMKQDLTEKEEVEVEKFEQAQEEQAIISYEELLRASKEKKELEMDQESDTPISNRELEEALEKKRKKEELLQKQEAEKKSGFQTTQFISPVYGIQEDKKKKETIRTSFKNLKIEPLLDEFPEIPEPYEQTISESRLDDIEVETVDEDVNKNAEFLDALKEFRKNLE